MPAVVSDGFFAGAQPTPKVHSHGKLWKQGPLPPFGVRPVGGGSTLAVRAGSLEEGLRLGGVEGFSFCHCLDLFLFLLPRSFFHAGRSSCK